MLLLFHMQIVFMREILIAGYVYLLRFSHYNFLCSSVNLILFSFITAYWNYQFYVFYSKSTAQIFHLFCFQFLSYFKVYPPFIVSYDLDVRYLILHTYSARMCSHKLCTLQINFMCQIRLALSGFFCFDTCRKKILSLNSLDLLKMHNKLCFNFSMYMTFLL